MDDPCGISDLRQLVEGGNAHFPQSTFPQIVPQLFCGQQNFAQAGEDSHHRCDLMGMTGHCLISDIMPEFNSECVTATRTASAGPGATSLSNGFEVETACDGGDGPGSGRWPRKETLALLEIRTRLDHKFREANQKGPLWDEVSRFMSEEHGYQRSGKKCREKFENLYKYYRKTKEGKAGRLDGKHYRFFRQLDALYGETKNAVSFPQTDCLETRTFQLHDNGLLRAQKANQEACLSNCSEFNSTSSDENGIFTAGLADSDVYGEKRRKRQGRSWGEKIKVFIDFQVRKVMEKQEVWLDKLMKTLEQKERERMVREEEWRRQDVLRIEREQKIWAKERECIEARDAALMAALGKLTGRELANSFQMAENGDEGDAWPESRKSKEFCKKRKEKSSLFGNVNVYSPCNVGGGRHDSGNSDHGLGESSMRQANKEFYPCSSINGVHGSCLKFLMNEGEPLWEN